MNRTFADSVAGALVALVVLVGLVTTWQAYQQTQSGMMGQMHALHPLWTLLLTLLVASGMVGAYAVIRSELFADRTPQPGTEATATEREPEPEEAENECEPATVAPEQEAAADRSGQQLLDVLPEDEQRVLEPVVESPGITQVALRDRANFSKSKISQTVTDLEKRGLLYRERQGRTYRIYPATEVEREETGSRAEMTENSSDERS